jgi:hypothetical protein
MVFSLILLMGKKAFRPFLQALVVRSVALKREFISIPRWQQLSDNSILSSPICQLYIRFFSRGFSENCNMYDFSCINPKYHFREYSLQTSSIHCSVFGDVLIHDTSSASEGTQTLHIYINRLIDWLIGGCLAPTLSKFQLNGFFRRLFNIERVTNVVILYHIHV